MIAEAAAPAVTKISAVAGISVINTRQDMSRWTRAHADTPGINWSVFPGPGGTMIIVEHDQWTVAS